MESRHRSGRKRNHTSTFAFHPTGYRVRGFLAGKIDPTRMLAAMSRNWVTPDIMAQSYSQLPEKTDFALILPKQYFLAVAFGRATLEEGMTNGIVKVEGDPKRAAWFFASFDSHVCPIRLTLR